MITKVKLIIALTIVVYASPCVLAQDDLIKEAKLIKTNDLASMNSIERIVVSGSTQDKSLRDSINAIELIDDTALKAINATHPNQIFNTSSSTWVSRGNGQEHLTSIRSPVFTGAGACGNFYFSENTISLRASGFCNVNQLFDTHYEVAQSVEVFKGPYSSLYGSNALFGGIALQLPSANSDKPVNLQFDLAEFGYTRMSIDAPIAQNDHYIRSQFTLTHDNGYRASSGFDSMKWSASHLWHRSEFSIENGFTFSQINQDTAGYINGVGSYLDRELSRENEYPDAYRDAWALRAYSKLSWQFDNFLLTVTPYIRANKMDFLMHFVPWQPVEENGHNSLGIKVDWQSVIFNNVTLNSGLLIDYTQGFLTEKQSVPAPFSQDKFPVGNHYDYDVTGLKEAAYVVLNWQVTDKLIFEPMLRYDVEHFDYINNLSVGYACEADVIACRFYRPENGSNRFDAVSFKLGTVYHLSTYYSAFASYSNGFRTPHHTELYRLQSEDMVHTKKVESTGTEFGLRAQFPYLYYQFSFYNMKLKDGIFQNTERVYVNGSDTTHQGFEIEILWQALTNLSIKVNGGVAEHLYDNSPNLLGSKLPISGNEIDTAPNNMGSAQILWQANDKAHLELVYLLLGEYYLDPENKYEYQGHELVNGSIRYELADNLQIKIQVLNLLDEKYAERADVSFGTPRYFPGKERMAMLSLSFDM